MRRRLLRSGVSRAAVLVLAAGFSACERQTVILQDPGPLAGPSPPATLTTRSVFGDVHVALAAVLSSVGAPASMPFEPAYSVFGTITTRTGDAVRPVDGAVVELFMGGRPAEGDADSYADTFTNREGRFRLCAERDDFGLFVRAKA